MHISKFLKQVRNLLEFHKSVGITTYPLNPEIKQFLGPFLQTYESPEPTIPETKSKESAKFDQPPRPTDSYSSSTNETLTAIHQEMHGCTNCRLHEERNHVVLGEGAPVSGLMIIGEWPSLKDDLQNTPFGGEAGDLLFKMLKAINLDHDYVFITLAVKCRTPGNRTPNPDEVNTCFPILHRQIKAAAPKIICAMGPLASHALLKNNELLFRLRGHFHSYEGIPVMPTFSPAFLLKNPEMKKTAWLDLQMIQKKLTAQPR